MTRDEVRQFLDSTGAIIYRVWATPKPEWADVAEYRFPGLSFTGYLVESRTQILTFQEWLNIERIEVW